MTSVARGKPGRQDALGPAEADMGSDGEAPSPGVVASMCVPGGERARTGRAPWGAVEGVLCRGKFWGAGAELGWRARGLTLEAAERVGSPAALSQSGGSEFSGPWKATPPPR